MDTLLTRYRSIILLLVVLVGQLIFLAYQVKNDNDVRVIRIWAVTVITPIAQVAETTRETIYGVFHDYFDLRHARDDNRKMHTEMDKLKLENQFLRTELNTADRVKALAAFEKQSPSRLIAARIIGAASTSASKIVFLDRGSNAEVEKGMAVITPDGIVGKILAAYPTASQALLATDPGFAAGVVSQKNHVRGILRGIGSGKCQVDNVQNEETVDKGELFFTSGDDRIFPRGLPVGKADVVRDGPQFKDILLYPSGLQNGPEEVLIVLQGAHQIIPEYQEPAADEKVYLGQPPPEVKAATQNKPVLSTDADKLIGRYKQIGDLEGHKYGEGNVPNFNVNPGALKTPVSTPPKSPGLTRALEAARAGKASTNAQTDPASATPSGDPPVSLTEQRAPRSAKPPASNTRTPEAIPKQPAVEHDNSAETPAAPPARP